VILLGCSCKENEIGSYPSIASCDLVVVHHDGDGRLVDFLVFRELGDEKLLRVSPAVQTKDLFFVTVLGSKISPFIKSEGACMSSFRKGHKGRVDINIHEANVVHILDDGKLSPSHVSDEALKTVESFIRKKTYQLLKDPTIKVVKYSKPQVMEDIEEKSPNAETKKSKLPSRARS